MHMDINQHTHNIAVQLDKQINLYNYDDSKIVYHDSYNNQNQQEWARRINIKAKYALGTNKSFAFSKFHNMDGGLLFASDTSGQFQYFDLNGKAEINNPVASVNVATYPVVHISLPESYVTHNLFALSSGMGGVSLFDVR